MKRILLIDDNAAVRSAVKSMLEIKDFAITEAESGLREIQALESNDFDLAIVDIFMPHMDGLETIKALRERAPALRILAMSGFRSRQWTAESPDFLAMAVKLGAAHSLPKPFRAAELVQAVEVCLAVRSHAGHDYSGAEPVAGSSPHIGMAVRH